MHIYQSGKTICTFAGAVLLGSLQVEEVDRNGAVRAPDCGEFHSADGRLLVLGQLVEAEHFEMVASFLLKIDVAAKVKLRVVFQKSL